MRRKLCIFLVGFVLFCVLGVVFATVLHFVVNLLHLGVMFLIMGFLFLPSFALFGSLLITDHIFGITKKLTYEWPKLQHPKSGQ